MCIGLSLGFLDLLNPICSWLALAALVVARFKSKIRDRGVNSSRPLWPYGIALSVVAFIGWPSLLSVPTDGDTMIYHLPNAASWLHAHSVWTVDTYLWWYPPGSEIVAAVFIALLDPLQSPS
jgi:hypothetical protein